MLKEHTTYRHFLSKKPSYVSRKRQVKHKSTKKDRSHNHLAKESCSGSRQTTHLITTVKQKMRQLQGRVLHFLIALLKKNKNKKKTQVQLVLIMSYLMHLSPLQSSQENVITDFTCI